MKCKLADVQVKLTLGASAVYKLGIAAALLVPAADHYHQWLKLRPGCCILAAGVKCDTGENFRSGIKGELANIPAKSQLFIN